MQVLEHALLTALGDFPLLCGNDLHHDCLCVLLVSGPSRPELTLLTTLLECALVADQGTFSVWRYCSTLLYSFRWQGLEAAASALCVCADGPLMCSYPETKGLAIEDAPKIFRKHWFWKRYANRVDRTMVRCTGFEKAE